MNKEEQAEMIKKFLRQFHNKETAKQQIHKGYESVSRVQAPPTVFSNQGDNRLQDQLRKRQVVIEKLYNRSVVNKIYIFPRHRQNIQDLMSESSHSSINQMETVTTFRLYEPKKMKKQYVSTERLITGPKTAAGPPQSQKKRMKAKDSLDQCKKSRKRVQSSSFLQSSFQQSKGSKDSARLRNGHNISSCGLKNIPKKQAPQLSARQNNPNSQAQLKGVKTKKQTYKQLLERLESKSKEHLRQNSSKSRHNYESVVIGYQTKQKELKRQPFSNVCITKIMDKYNQIKIKTGVRDNRCNTQY